MITLRLIDYGTLVSISKMSSLDNIIKYLASISYEIYLIQYPVIFLFQDMEIPIYLKLFMMIVIILLISILLHFSLEKKDSFSIIRKIFFCIFLLFSIYGGVQFVTAKDYSKEMKELEAQLKVNEEMLLEKQKEYEEKLKEESADIDSIIEKYQNNEEALQEEVYQLPVVGIGDSVMLGAVSSLYEMFPNGYFDAKISRTAWVASGIIKDLSKRGILGNPVIINLGANGDCPDSCKREIMSLIGNREVFWLNVTNDKDVNVNAKLNAFAKNYSNLHIIDWASVTKGHPEYFVADGIHLTSIGCKVYTETIYQAIYQVYLDRLNEEKDAEIQLQEEEHRNKNTFYGNEVLLSIFDSLQGSYSDSKFVIDKDSDYEVLLQELQDDKDQHLLNNQLVFIYDRFMTEENYQEIVRLCDEQRIIIVLFDEMNLEYENDRVYVVPFYKELNEHEEYFLTDGIHLSDEGKKALVSSIQTIMNES